MAFVVLGYDTPTPGPDAAPGIEYRYETRTHAETSAKRWRDTYRDADDAPARWFFVRRVL